MGVACDRSLLRCGIAPTAAKTQRHQTDHAAHRHGRLRNLSQSIGEDELADLISQDVRIKRVNLPTQNRESVFARMRAERERIARQYRAEGEAEAMKIRAEADKEKARVLSEAYREAERIRGDGDAESTRVYAAAYARDPKFYKLVRTLEAYRKVIDPNTTAILSSDSELLRLLTQGRAK